jgi:hypothetical protein
MRTIVAALFMMLTFFIGVILVSAGTLIRFQSPTTSSGTLTTTSSAIAGASSSNAQSSTTTTILSTASSLPSDSKSKLLAINESVNVIQNQLVVLEMKWNSTPPSHSSEYTNLTYPMISRLQSIQGIVVGEGFNQSLPVKWREAFSFYGDYLSSRIQYDKDTIQLIIDSATFGSNSKEALDDRGTLNSDINFINLYRSQFEQAWVQANNG